MAMMTLVLHEFLWFSLLASNARGFHWSPLIHGRIYGHSYVQCTHASRRFNTPKSAWCERGRVKYISNVNRLGNWNQFPFPQRIIIRSKLGKIRTDSEYLRVKGRKLFFSSFVMDNSALIELLVIVQALVSCLVITVWMWKIKDRPEV